MEIEDGKLPPYEIWSCDFSDEPQICEARFETLEALVFHKGPLEGGRTYKFRIGRKFFNIFEFSSWINRQPDLRQKMGPSVSLDD